MKINVIFLLRDKKDDFFTGKNVVIIDILRATSTMVTALSNGANGIFPVSSVEEAVKISKNLERTTYLLCGERNTKVIEGFDLGNSPLEYTEKVVSGKKIILTTTNGTKVFDEVKHSKNVLIVSSLNVSVVAKKMIEIADEWYLICSGRNGCYDESDALCAGLLIYKIIQNNVKVELNDAGRTALVVYKSTKANFNSALKKTEHGKILIANGFEMDIDFISNIDSLELLAIYLNNTVSVLQ